MSETLAAKERLRASVELMTSIDSVGAMVSVADLAFILASHDAMETALAFYANSENWKSPSSGFALQYDPQPAPARADYGIRARQALRAGVDVDR
jgi:hypothetical protein